MFLALLNCLLPRTHVRIPFFISSFSCFLYYFLCFFTLLLLFRLIFLPLFFPSLFRYSSNLFLIIFLPFSRLVPSFLLLLPSLVTNYK